MADPTRDALLVAVTRYVSSAEIQTKLPKLRKGEKIVWPLVAAVMNRLTPSETGSKNKWRNRHQRAAAGVSASDAGVSSEGVDSGRYRPLVDAAVIEWVTKQPSPGVSPVLRVKEPQVAPDPVEEAMKDMAWASMASAGGMPSQAESPEDGEETVVTPDMLRRVWEALINAQDAMSALDMTKPVVEISIPTKKPWGGIFFSDQHVLGVGVNHRCLEEDMRTWQAHKDILGVFDLGDNLDQFLPTKHPSAMMETLARPGVQRALVKHLWKKYLSEVLKAKVRGNHDAWSSAADYDFAGELAQEMNVPFLGDGGRVWLHVGKQTYKLELRHDFPFKSSLNTTNSQRRLFEFALGADVVCFGHLHYPDMHFAWRNGQNVALLRCSTYKETDSYAQSKGLQLGYAPPPPDMPMVVFWPDQHRILPFRNYRDGLIFLKSLCAI